MNLQKKLLFIAAFFLLGTFLYFSFQDQKSYSNHSSKAVENSQSTATVTENRTSEETDNSDAKSNPAPEPAVKNYPADPHERLASLRKPILRQVNTADAADDFLRFHELTPYKAVEKKSYQKNMGDIFAKVGGYVILQEPTSENLLTQFDGSNKPVVSRKGKNKFGVVTGELVVEFHKNTNLNEFSAKHDLNLVATLPKISKGIFTPRNFPANLLALAHDLKATEDVKDVEISVIEGQRVPH